MIATGRLRAKAATAILMLCGCADVPPDRYGVRKVEIEGARRMSPQALRNCLATRPRERAGATLGVIRPGDCGEPSFTADPPRVQLWAWPWTPWPLFDRLALERDRQRVERWYRARGFHHARVTDVRVEPPEAAEDDTLPEKGPAPCERMGAGEGCAADVTIEVEEGRPTLVREVAFEGLEKLPKDVARRIRRARSLREGDRFDEALYDESQATMREVLADASYARAEVRGVTRIDRDQRKAWITYEVQPGPPCVFGDVIVEGNEYLPAAPIEAAVLIDEGAPYDFEAIVDAQRAVQALGSFSAVTVEPLVPEEGNVVDVRVDVTPAREDVVALGGGIQAGELRTLTERISVPQWDVHLVARYENRNLFGGMRQLTIEERPRMIVQQRFPRVGRPRAGNTLSIELRQPGLFEPRTTGIVSASHIFGPDPFDTFFRHRIDSEVALERMFLSGRLHLRFGLKNSVYRVPSGEQRFDGTEPPADSVVTFPEQVVRFDFRDDTARPHGGALLQLTSHEAGYFLPSSWDYIRLLPDARVYVPFPARVTLAARFALGMFFITHADDDLDPLQAQLGPRDYRLRGGGASSNRGFLPGRLGDGLDGGTRRWLASVELRVPVIQDLGMALFWDMGDVSREERFRFDHPQAATGFGFRYYTIVGAIRLDFAWKVPGLQVLAAEDRRIDDVDAMGDPRGRGGRFVFHLTIGEPF